MNLFVLKICDNMCNITLLRGVKMIMNKKHFYIVIILGVILGLALSVYGSIYNLNSDEMFKILIIIAVILYVFIFAFNIISMLKFQNYIAYLNDVLVNEYDVDRFLKLTGDYFNKVKLKGCREILMLNISAGQSCKGDYELSIETLKMINIDLLKGINKAVYYNNLAQNYFMVQNIDEGTKTIEDNMEILNKYINDNMLGPFIQTTFALKELLTENYKKCEDILNNASRSNKVAYLEEDIKIIFAKLYLKTGRKDEAVQILNRLSNSRVFPSVLKEIEKIFSEINNDCVDNACESDV